MELLTYALVSSRLAARSKNKITGEDAKMLRICTIRTHAYYIHSIANNLLIQRLFLLLAIQNEKKKQKKTPVTNLRTVPSTKRTHTTYYCMSHTYRTYATRVTERLFIL